MILFFLIKANEDFCTLKLPESTPSILCARVASDQAHLDACLENHGVHCN